MANQDSQVDPFLFLFNLAALVTVTLIICLLSLHYKRNLRKCGSIYKNMPRITVLMFLAIQWIRNLTYQILGKSYRVFVPFFIYIFFFLWFSSLITILGFNPLAGNLVITVSLATLVFLGTLASGIFHRGLEFFGDYVFWVKIKGRKVFPIIDPLKLIGELSKLLSLTCRLWGNTLAGALILHVVYEVVGMVFRGKNIEYIGPMLIPLFVFPLHIYFDVLGGTIHALIFLVLTMCY